MSRSERDRWAAVVRDLAADRGLRYEAVGGLNPREGPVALCPGGSNRITGELEPGFWGACCDALEHEEGGPFRRAVVPEGLLIKSHMPDLARVVPSFNVESIEVRPADQLAKRSSLRVEFESIDFNRRFIATVPRDHDPVALRELFSPAFLTWSTTIDREVDFGGAEGQLWFMWRMRERTRAELELALRNAGELFRRTRGELEEADVVTFAAGPWNAGLQPFPGRGGGAQPS